MIYTAAEACKLQNDLQRVFDVARFVNPVTREVLCFDCNGSASCSSEVCHSVWGKQSRCENCVSMRAQNARQRMTKYELIGNEMYSVLSKPIEVRLCDGTVLGCNLELVNHVSDDVLFSAVGKEKLVQNVMEASEKLYVDSLTGAYNRRFFDERAFCHYRDFDIGKRVCFVVLDLRRFKDINDHYGHLMGDRMLRETVRCVKSCLRKKDSVIRMGGDEFLLVLDDLSEKEGKAVTQRIRESLGTVVYDEKANRALIGDFGVAATEAFDESETCIAALCGQADSRMYEEKHAVVAQS